MKIPIESIIKFFRQIFRIKPKTQNYPESYIEPRFQEKKKAKKYKLKFEGEKDQIVNRAMRRKCKEQLPLPESIKKKIRA